MSIRLVDLQKKYDQVTALSHVSVEVKKGEFLAVLGPSGCGKSTLLRVLSGLEEATSGNIFIDGKEVTNLPPAKRRISMVFQSYALFPHLTVRDNIVFGLVARKHKKPEIKKRLSNAVEILDIAELLDRKPGELSGGQQQRVALGRALVAQRSVCLMDEPLSNLDAALRNQMRCEIRSLQRRLGITMVYVTHDQVEAMTMADRIVLMNKGRIEQTSTPDDLYFKPQSIFSAKFIGTPPINLLPPSVLQIEAANEQLLVGIRPEHFRLSSNGTKATVEDFEHLGADTLLICQVGETEVLVRIERNTMISKGKKIHISWDQKNHHFFHRSSGVRVTP